MWLHLSRISNAKTNFMLMSRPKLFQWKSFREGHSFFCDSFIVSKWRQYRERIPYVTSDLDDEWRINVVLNPVLTRDIIVQSSCGTTMSESSYLSLHFNIVATRWLCVLVTNTHTRTRKIIRQVDRQVDEHSRGQTSKRSSSSNKSDRPRPSKSRTSDIPSRSHRQSKQIR